jgi:hypothetical protein
MPIYTGSCHCGAVQFQIEADITELITCDCSLCAKKNALMAKVHESGFTMLSSWDTVGEYRWNTMVARHHFCKTCGIYTFHKRRSQPDHYGINVRCLDAFDATAIPVRKGLGAALSVPAKPPTD